MSKELKGAEIFHSGEWPGAGAKGITFSDDDLDAVVSSFDALSLKGRIPLKLGHDGKDVRNDGAPALGWVSRVWREGQKLFADFEGIPDAVYSAIKEGLYKNVSVEMLRNVTAGTRKLPWVLDAVALLGAAQPAVGILKDLQALTMSQGTGLQCDERAAFRQEFTTTGGKSIMTEEEEKALRKQLAEANDERIKMHREKITERFEAAVKAGLAPALREQFYKFSGVNDDAKVLSVTMGDVDTYLTSVGGKKEAAKNDGDGKEDRTSRVSGGERLAFVSATNAGAYGEAMEKVAVSMGYKAHEMYNLPEIHDRVTMAVAQRYPEIVAAYGVDPNGEFKLDGKKEAA